MIEYNFDGLIGPTHHYGGLSSDNKASQTYRSHISNPKNAALQGLEKMKVLYDLEIHQAILPPLIRPNLNLLESMGINVKNSVSLRNAYSEMPDILSAAFSASSMWVANAATVSPSSDTQDGKLHITIANLQSHLHRKIESPETLRLFNTIFGNDTYFQIHPPLPSTHSLRDEGAANHTRLIGNDEKGIHIFSHSPEHIGRQGHLASETIARNHKLDPNKTFYLEQSAHCIQKGVFHNDVIATGNNHLYLYHETAYENSNLVIAEIIDSLKEQNIKIIFKKILEKEISLKTAIDTYLFNSQIVISPTFNNCLIAPIECKENPQVFDYINCLIYDPNIPIDHVEYVDLRESMRNGGGPACLRLRIPLNKTESRAIHQGVLFNDDLYGNIKACITQHYSEKLCLKDFTDTQFIKDLKKTYREIYDILGLDITGFL
jgi:succinylarginine dihydrolase